MKVKQKTDIVSQEIVDAFGIEVPPNDIDIDGIAEDMCTADDASQLRMTGIYLYRALYDDKRCSDGYNLSMFLLTLLPLSDSTAEYYRQQRLDFLNSFSAQQIRLMLFVIMKLSENKTLNSEVTEFITFWTSRYLEIQEA